MRTLRPLLALGVSLLCGCGPESAGPGATTIRVGNRRVVLPTADWRAMPNEAEYARNFEAVTNKPPRQYQIVTVFLNRMSQDRLIGQQISATKYLEVFLSNPDEVTVLLRRDHGSYWLLSREMFRGVSVPSVDLDRVGSLSAAEIEQITGILRNQIDGTRYVLGEQLLAR